MTGRLEELLAAAGCEALVVLASSSRDPDLAPFVRGAHLGPAFLVARRGGALRLGYSTPMERDEAGETGLPLLGPTEWGLRELRRESGLVAALGVGAARSVAVGLPPGARVAIAGHAPAATVLSAVGSLCENGLRPEEGTRLLQRWRKHKPDWQVAEVRRVAAGVGGAMRAVANQLAAASVRGGELWLGEERLVSGRLRALVSGIFAEHELEQPEGNIVAAGAASAVAHSRGDAEHVLRPGETLVVDLFPRGLLFADCTRTFVVGPVEERVRDAFQVTLEVLRAAAAACRPGEPARDLQQAACDRFEAAGYASPASDPETTVGFVHTLGHGVGFELHEEPSFRAAPEDGGALDHGDVLTLEPGLYDPEAGWGIRLEDLVHLGPDGLENLTPLPYDLDPRAWP